MPFTHTVEINYRGLGTSAVLSSYPVSAGLESNINESIPDAAADQQVDWAVDISQIKSFVLRANGGALSIKTNSTSVPQETIALADGKPVHWDENAHHTIGSIFAGDITKLYVSNSSGNAVTLEILCLVDPTV